MAEDNTKKPEQLNDEQLYEVSGGSCGGGSDTDSIGLLR